MTNFKFIFFYVFIASIIFIIDLFTPLGIASGILYVILVQCGSWSKNTTSVFYLAVVGSILTIIGFFLSEEAGIDWIVLINRCYALILIWITAISLWWIRKSKIDKNLKQTNLQAIASKKTVLIILSSFAVIALMTWQVLFIIERDIKADTKETIEVILANSHTNLRNNNEAQKKAAEIWANSPEIIQNVENLTKLPTKIQNLINSEYQSNIRKIMTPMFKSVGYRGFFIIGNNNINLASSRDINIGTVNLLTRQGDFLRQIWEGQTLLSLPLESDVPLIDIHGQMIEKLATMFVATPIINAQGNAIAILTFRIDPDEFFAAALNKATLKTTGETYAFDKNGTIISESHFIDQLNKIGLLQNQTHSDLKIQLRDPGIDLTRGHQQKSPRENQPLTKMAQSAINGIQDTNLIGYRDYRGVQVIGTWLWDPELNIGIATEIDFDEAYETYHNLRFIIFTFSGAFIVVFIFFVIFTAIFRQTLWDAKSQAEIANRTKTELMANMSHELRTPLNAIIGFSSIMQEELFGTINKKYLGYANDIHQSGKHLLELINDILDVSAIEAKKVELGKENLNIENIISSTIKMVEGHAKNGNIELDYSVENDLPMLFADKRRLIQILLNTLSNSIKFTPKGGHVSLDVSLSTHNEVVFTIADTGVGMNEEDLEKAMSKFGQVNNSLGKRHEGTGLGLPLTLGLVELHDATLEIESVKDKGTTIIICFQQKDTINN